MTDPTFENIPVLEARADKCGECGKPVANVFLQDPGGGRRWWTAQASGANYVAHVCIPENPVTQESERVREEAEADARRAAAAALLEEVRRRSEESTRLFERPPSQLN